MGIDETLAVNVCSVPSPLLAQSLIASVRIVVTGKQGGKRRENGKLALTMTLCRFLSRRPLERLFVQAGCSISSRHPLIAPPSR